jgi:MraZ protein
MILITGEYDHIIDDKGRVLVTNKLRNQIDVEQFGVNLYLVVGANGILCLYPQKCFERVAAAMAQKNTAPDETVANERMNFALAGKVELDSQGRLLLSEKLRKRAGLKNNVTLIGVRDHIEIWNSEDWEQYATDKMSSFQKRAAEVRQEILEKQNQEIEKA